MAVEVSAPDHRLQRYIHFEAGFPCRGRQIHNFSLRPWAAEKGILFALPGIREFCTGDLLSGEGRRFEKNADVGKRDRFYISAAV